MIIDQQHNTINNKITSIITTPLLHHLHVHQPAGREPPMPSSSDRQHLLLLQGSRAWERDKDGLKS